MLRVGFIGKGSVCRAARSALASLDEPIECVGTLVRPGTANGSDSVEDIDALLTRKPHLIAECASHSAVAAFGEPILRSGVSFLVVSIGALCDDGLHDRLTRAAREGGASLLLASGAAGGLDALRAARLGGLEQVLYRARKPAMSWSGNGACAHIDLAHLAAPQTIYRGTAREAARLFPKNSNVAAAVALAGIGLDRTRVELIADPHAVQNHHEIHFTGADGEFTFHMTGVPSPDNPKTSLLTAHSVAQAVAEFGSRR